MKREVWVPAPGYEDSHMISNRGRIKGVARSVYRLSQHGNLVEVHLKEKILSTKGRDGGGYPMVCIYERSVKIHRLVAKAFVPGEAPGLEVNHKDGVKANCVDTNLEWVTRSQNMQHAVDNGLRKQPAEVHNQVKVRSTCLSTGRRRTFKSLRDAASILLGNVLRNSAISMCLSGKIKQAYGYKWERV